MPSIEQLERLLEADPDDPFVLYAIAQEHAKAERHDQAVRFYDRCLETDPAYCYAYFHKARSLEAAGREGEALAALRRGAVAARDVGDAKASSEIQAYIDELEP